MKTIVHTNNVTKIHEGRTIIEHVSLTIKKGEIYGLVGPNGAGKTTFMKMLLNLIKPTSGAIEIFGEKVGEVDYKYLRQIGSIIEIPVFYEELTVVRNLEIHAQYKGYHNPKRIEEVLDIVGLTATRNTSVKKCSLGMKQRLGIARAILTKPKLLLLDEPVNGLDPSGMREMRSVFTKLAREEGMSMLISSHMLSELELIADSIAIMQKGKLIQQVTMAEIAARNMEYYILETTNAKKALVYLTSELHISNCKIMDDTHIRIYEQGISYQEFIVKLSSANIEILSFAKEKNTLEDFFLHETEMGDFHV